MESWNISDYILWIIWSYFHVTVGKFPFVYKVYMKYIVEMFFAYPLAELYLLSNF